MRRIRALLHATFEYQDHQACLKPIKALRRATHEYQDHNRQPWRRGKVALSSRFYKRAARRAVRRVGVQK